MRDADDAEIMKKRMYSFLLYNVQFLNVHFLYVRH
jgi:hypothetical protein